MPRRMPLSHDAMRARAVAAARAVVAAEGLAALGARRIAADLGCSVGSLYNLFVDLDDLVLHTAAAVVEDMAAALFDEPLPDAAAAALVEIALRYVRFARREGRPWAMVFEHEPGHDRPTPEWYLKRIADLVARVRAVAAPAFDVGLDAAALAATVDVLWAGVHGIAALSQKDKLGFVTGTDAEAMAARLVVAVLAGAGAAASPPR